MVEAVIDFLFLGSNIIADCDCSHDIRRWLLLGRKAMKSLDIVLKSRDLTLPTNVCIVKIFPVITYSCESCTIKKAECQKIDAFKLWCWRRLLKVLWTARKSNQSILKEINPEHSLEGLMLKLQYFGYLKRTDKLLGKSLMLGKKWKQQEKGRQRMRWLDGTWILANSGRWWGTEAWCAAVHGSQRVQQDWATEQQEQQAQKR